MGLRLWRQVDCALLWRRDGLDLAPGEPYTAHLTGLDQSPDQLVLGVLEGSELLFLSGNPTCPAPSSQVNALNTVQTATNIAVSWSATDPGQVLTSYDIQVRDGDAEAPWADWLISTADTSAIYNGQPNHTYTFRSRAHDVFGRVEEWPANGWQDTITTLLSQPAPVLITSAKVAQPLCVFPGDVVEFQIHLDNTGNLAAGIQLTDQLPANLYVTTEPWISHDLPDPILVGNTLTWSGTLTVGQTVVAIGFETQVLDVEPGEEIVNTAQIDVGANPTLHRQVTLKGCQRFYVPLVLKDWL
jgi:uncharacterized repeat protein (TIGR01451 family)